MVMERDVRQRNRRRARAQRMKAVGDKNQENHNGNETGEDEHVHTKPPRPTHRRRKTREPLYEEDVIDGFAIASFKSYSDLERAVKHAERRGLSGLEPLPAPGTGGGRLVTSLHTRRRRKSSDGRTQGGGNSSGDGYFCDHSASDDDKGSDSGSGIFPARRKLETPLLTSSTNGVVVTSPLTTATTTCVTAPAAARTLPNHNHQVVNGPSRCSEPVTSRGFLPHPGLASYPTPSASVTSPVRSVGASSGSASAPQSRPSQPVHAAASPVPGSQPGRPHPVLSGYPPPAPAACGAPPLPLTAAAHTSVVTHASVSRPPVVVGAPYSSGGGSAAAHTAHTLVPGAPRPTNPVKQPSVKSVSSQPNSHRPSTSIPANSRPGQPPASSGYHPSSHHGASQSSTGTRPNAYPPTHPLHLSAHQSAHSSPYPSPYPSHPSFHPRSHPSQPSSSLPSSTHPSHSTSHPTVANSHPSHLSQHPTPHVSHASPLPSHHSRHPSPYPGIPPSLLSAHSPHPSHVSPYPSLHGGVPAHLSAPRTTASASALLSSRAAPHPALYHHPAGGAVSTSGVPTPSALSCAPTVAHASSHAQSARHSPYARPHSASSRPGRQPSPHPVNRPSPHQSPHLSAAPPPAHASSTVVHAGATSVVPPGPLAPSAVAGVPASSKAASAASSAPPRLRFGVSDLVSPSTPSVPSAVTAPAATAALGGPPPVQRASEASPAPAALPSAVTPSRAPSKPPKHRPASESPASLTSGRGLNSPLDHRHPYSGGSSCGPARPGSSAAARQPSPRRTPPVGAGAGAASARSPLSVGVFAPPPGLMPTASVLPAVPVPAAGLPPPPPPPPSATDALPAANKAEMLRQELNTRFLASQDHSIAVGPPPYLRAGELHQHQHTHAHHHHPGAPQPAVPAPPPPPPVPPLLKSAPKLGSVNSPFFRTGVPALAPLSSPLAAPRPPPGAAPFLPPVPLQLSAPKKTGRWNAMHVRIAWEIYKNQQRSSSSSHERAAHGGLPPGVRPPDALAAAAGAGAPELGRGVTPLSPMLTAGSAGAPAHLRPASLLDGAAPPHPLAASAFPRFPSLAPSGSSAFPGLVLPPPPPPPGFLDRPTPAPAHHSAPLAGLDSWNRFVRPAAPTSSWASLKPEPLLASRGAPYSPAVDADARRPASAERRPATATPPRRDHSRSPLRLKLEPTADDRDRTDRHERSRSPLTPQQKIASRHHVNGAQVTSATPSPATQSSTTSHASAYAAAAAAAAAAGSHVRPPYAYGPGPPPPPHPLDPYMAAAAAGGDPLRESLERDRALLAAMTPGGALSLYRDAELARFSQSRELERMALERDRQLFEHKLMVGMLGGAAPPPTPGLHAAAPYPPLRPPPPPDPLHLVSSYKPVYPAGPALGPFAPPPLAALGAVSSAQLRRLEPGAGPAPLGPAMPRREPDLGR